MTTVNSKSMQIREGVTYLDVSHQNGKISFVYPAFGEDTHIYLYNLINAKKLNMSTSAQMVSLIYAAWQNPKERYQAEIINIFKNYLLLTFTGNLYLPGKGVYLQDRPEIRIGNVIMEESNLLKILASDSFDEGGVTFSKDRSVRFVPFGFKIGEQRSKELAKNPYAIAFAGGQESAEKLAEAASNFNYNSSVWQNLENLKRCVVRSSVIHSVIPHQKLHIDGFMWEGLIQGLGFGVSQLDQADAKSMSIEIDV